MVTDRLVLRAELSQNGRRIVAHTIELTPRSVFVRTDELVELGSLVELELSFPRLLPPIRVSARVESRDGGSGHGLWPGLVLALTAEDDRIAKLLSSRAPAANTRPFRVLVVEDSPTMRDVMEHHASRFSLTFPIHISSVERAEQALELVAREHFDLAILDLFLPGVMSGADLVRELRRQKGDLPVIGFSIGGPNARVAFLDAGADLFLDKPIMIRDVFATLERLDSAARVSS